MADAAVRRPPRFSGRGILFVVLGLVGVGIGINATEYRPFGAILATLSFALGASLLGRPARLSAALKPLVGRVVRVSAWGEPLPGSAGALYVVETITGIGARLHIQLFRHDDEESGGVLKIAQPAGETLGDERIEIASAKYVQWARRKVDRPAGTREPALVITLP
jgi:hypothetical protein